MLAGITRFVLKIAPMLLKEFIEQTGDAVSAELFGVKERTTASWRRGERMPRHKQAELIVKATDGVVSYAECFGQTSKAA